MLMLIMLRQLRYVNDAQQDDDDVEMAMTVSKMNAGAFC